MRTWLRRRDTQHLPWVVGALAAVVLSVVGYVSYTALNGLPFQSTYDVTVELPDASRLVVNDTVRIRGVRVGRVAGVDARPATAAHPGYASIRLALGGSTTALPVDTKVRTRAGSVLGVSYVELSPGTSSKTVPDGGKLPLRNASATVEVTDLFAVFERGMRRDVRETAAMLGGGLAGRGPDLNALVGGLRRLVGPLTTVSATLAAPSTDVSGWIRGYGQFTTAVAAVSQDLAGMMHGGAVTFDALARERPALGRAMAALPTAETAATTALARVNPSLRRLADIAERLQPASRTLAPSLTATNRALLAGVPVLQLTPAFASRLRDTLEVLEAVTRRKTTGQTIGRLTDVVTTLRPTVDALEAAQVNCNVIASMFQNAIDLAAFPLVGRDPSNAPPIFGAMAHVSHLGAEGEVLQQGRPSRNSAINYLPHENADECESGNEMHDAVGQVLGNPPGNQGKASPPTSPPDRATRYAREAGLLDRPEGWSP